MIRTLDLSADEVGTALDICPTAASRKIAAAEKLLAGIIIPAFAARCRQARADRVRTAVLEPLRTVVAIAAVHPDELAPWVTRLVAESRWAFHTAAPTPRRRMGISVASAEPVSPGGRHSRRRR